MGLLRLARKPPVVVAPNATVMDAVRTMVEHKTGSVAIVDRNRIVGIFTERDVMDRVAYAKRDLDKTPITEVMSREVKCVTDATSVKEAVALMRQNKIRHLPIVNDQGILEGVVALRYLLFDIVDDLEKEATSLRSYMGADGPGG